MNLKKLIAILLSLIMCLALVPAYAVTQTTASAAMSAEQRAAAIAELKAFSSKLGEMRSTYGADYSKRDASDPYATCRIIVKYAGELEAEGALAQVSGHNDWHILQYADRDLAEKACKQFSKMKGVQYAEPDIIMHIEEAERGSYMSWGYNANNVDADSYNTWLLDYYGGSVANIPTVVVAVIDTGADATHPFISSRLVPGYDFANNDSNPADDHYHGTHVSGTVIDGTLANVKVMPIKVLDAEGYAETSTVALGIEYAYLNGCDVQNMSLGGDCDGLDGPEHMMMYEAIEASCNAGCVVCVAAGNESDNAAYHCPANVERAITVAAIGEGHSLAYFSNYGAYVDLHAPGVNVRSSVPGGGYEYLSGTSMACPHTAAAAAMVKSYDKNLGSDEVADILKNAAVDIGITNAGTGMLNVTDLFKFDLIINAEGESNHFTSTGVYPWMTDETSAFSGNTGINGSVSTLVCKRELGAYQVVTFEYKVSSQQGDFFRFKANGNSLLEVSGEHDWQTASIAVPANGLVTLSWEYAKDGSGSAGGDKAWVRNIRIEETLSSIVNDSSSCILFSSDGSYPWTADPAEQAAKSGNAGVNNSVSSMTGSFRMTEGMVFSFDYKVSSASGDTFAFIVNGNTVMTSGSTAGYQHYTYPAPASRTYTVEFRYTKDGSGSSGSDCAWVRGAGFTHTFATAANVMGADLPFTNNSTYPWVVCEDYVTSSNAGHASTQSWFKLDLDMVAGETLSFRYSVSSESNYDFFYFYVDGTSRLSASGESGWQTYTFTATMSKTYTFKWSFEKDFSVDGHDDRACVDDISYSGWHPVVMGDVNSDGDVNAVDALAILRYTLGLIGPDQIDLACADVDYNGSVNATDALTVLRSALGLAAL